MDLGLFICRKPFFFYPEPGQPHQVLPGMVARKGHPVIDAEPSAWKKLEVRFEVEQKPPTPEPTPERRPEPAPTPDPKRKPERGAKRS